MTVLEVLNASSDYLDKHGVESPRLNAEHLLAHVLGKKRIELYMEFDRVLGEAERAPLRDLIRQRGTGRPLQHLLGTVEFHGRVFASDSRALIPRPETEQLVEFVLAGCGPAQRFMDVGTGSGVIAITLALEKPGVIVHATDVSDAALSLARENSARHSASVTFHIQDLLPTEGDPYDIIVANLPYIPTAEIPSLSREVQLDPVSALDGGVEGLDLIEKLIFQSKSRMNPNGQVFLEIGHDQASRVASFFSDQGYSDIRRLKDYQGVERFVAARN